MSLKIENNYRFGFIVAILLKNLRVLSSLVQDKYSEVEIVAWL